MLRLRPLLPLLLIGACQSRSPASEPDAALARDSLAAAEARRGDARAPDLASLAGAVEAARYQADLLFVAQPRPPGSAHWQKVQDLCFERLGQLGYAAERASFGGGTNVIGKLRGGKQPERQVIISAHYDHLPDCAGADDNASGVAGALEAARVLASVAHDRTLVVAFWDQEEAGLLGSSAYALQAEQRGDSIDHAYVFDMIGYKSDQPGSQTIPDGMGLLWPEQVAAVKANQMRADFIVACFDETASSQAAVDALVAEARAVSLPLYPMVLPAALKDLELLKPLYNGDHASFWKHGFPATMLNDTSTFRQTNYHCQDGPDTPERLDAGFAVKIVQATVGSAARLLRAGGG